MDGANTTPLAMVMEFFLPRYKGLTMPGSGKNVIDTILTAKLERGYTHFLLGRDADVDLVAYVMSWMPFVADWGTGSGDDRGTAQRVIDLLAPRYDAFIARGQSFLDQLVLMPMQEGNNGASPETVEAVLQWACAKMRPYGVPVFTHFTPNYPSYERAGESHVNFWERASAAGVAGAYWQAGPDDPLGLMGAHAWDARKVMAAANPALRFTAFELRAESQLYGKYTEEDGALTGLGMLHCPIALGSNAPGVSGAAAARHEDGTPV